MAFLRKALRGAAGGAQEELQRQAAVRLRQAEIQQQQGFQREQQDRQFEQQILMQLMAQQAAREKFQLERRFKDQDTQRETMAELFANAGDTTKSLPGMIQTAKGVGVEDPSMGSGGAQITLPSGQTRTHIARPMDPTTGELRAERSSIEELINARQQAEDADWRSKIEEFEQGPQIGPDGTEIEVGPGGRSKQTGLSFDQEADKAVTAQTALMPGAVQQAGREAGARAAAVPQVVGGINPLTGEGQFSRVNVVTGEENPLQIAPRPAGTGGDSTGARAEAVLGQLGRFKELAGKINTASPGLGRFTTGAGNVLQQATAADQEEYGRLRGPLGLSLAVIIQGSRPTDTDAKLSAQLLPDFFTSKPVADSLIAQVEASLAAATAANKARGIDLANMSMDEILRAAEAGQLAQVDSIADIIARAQAAEEGNTGGSATDRARRLQDAAFGGQ